MHEYEMEIKEPKRNARNEEQKILKIKNVTEGSLDSTQPGKKSGNPKVSQKKVHKIKHKEKKKRKKKENRAPNNCGITSKNLSKEIFLKITAK